MEPGIAQRIATELEIDESQVQATIRLLEGGATVPFIARYRKEMTGGLDDTQLRHLAERLRYLTELDDRRQVIMKSIEAQGKMTPMLAEALRAAESKVGLEDLYLPYKPKRRTRAQLAREAGLAPLAEGLLSDPTLDPLTLAASYVSDQIEDSQAALEGARAILIERFAEDASLLNALREKLWDQAELTVTVLADKAQEGAKFSDYFNYRERLKSIPSHRALAVQRGRHDGILNVSLCYQSEDIPSHQASVFEQQIALHFMVSDQGRAADKWLLDSVRVAWRAKIFPALETELFARLKQKAEADAIRVFATNLHDLLLAAPAGQRITMGLDPGVRTGVKVAVVDKTGKLLETTTIYPYPPKNDRQGALTVLAKLIERYAVELIAIGNGTASRETDKLVQQLISSQPKYELTKVLVSEAGASVYSASELAAKEFPELDVSLRGAVSIARRLQDPLAELVKIDPKSIGVGQYQHDVNQHELARTLEAVVEDCVNAVGVELNTASAALLTRISGLNATLASNIVAWRDQHGAFRNRQALLKVPRLGEKTFEQAAGFLRIRGGDNPLDASSVHPEAYPVVERMLLKCQCDLSTLIGDADVLASLKPAEFVDERFGLPTVRDILRELEKPGRDPRPQFSAVSFLDSVQDIHDLLPGMTLEGVVTNVTNFGAFVDIGVHQDGLIHISELSNHYVEDPRQCVKAGDIVTVHVLNVDIIRRRIALTRRSHRADNRVPGLTGESDASTGRPQRKKTRSQTPSCDDKTAMGAAFAKWLNKQ